MPDIVRVRNITGDELVVGLLGRSVEPDCVVDFVGEVTADEDDHYVIESGSPRTATAWPKATWAVESSHTVRQSDDNANTEGAAE